MPPRKPEGLERLQAGVKPLQKGQPDMNPDGVKDILPHLRRSYSLMPLNRGLTPPSVVLPALRAYLVECLRIVKVLPLNIICLSQIVKERLFLFTPLALKAPLALWRGAGGEAGGEAILHASQPRPAAFAAPSYTLRSLMLRRQHHAPDAVHDRNTWFYGSDKEK